jgi:hypothetical protein
VLGPKEDDNGFSADVRGVWQRVDRVTIQVRGGRLLPTCTRDGNVFCQHAGAVLLRWLREPSAFAQIATKDDESEETVVQPGIPRSAFEADEPTDELERHLDHETMNRLREIATRRGVRLAGSKKSDAVKQLAAALADPPGIDAAIASLTGEERLALDAVHLGSTETHTYERLLSPVFRALGGTGEPPVAAVADAGLVTHAHPGSYGQAGYVVPRAVAARLPMLESLVERAAIGKATIETAGAARLGPAEMFQVVALESQANPFGVAPPLPAPAWAQGYAALPSGFAIDPADTTPEYQPSTYAAMQRGYRMIARRLVTDAALERLAARTGQTADAVDFSIRLMIALEIARATPSVEVQSDRLQELLESPPAERTRRLATAWLAKAGTFELGLLGGIDDRLRVQWRPAYASGSESLPRAIAATARFLARLLARLPRGVWWDLRSLSEVVERLIREAVPSLERFRNAPTTGHGITLARVSNRSEDQPLNYRTSEGWSWLFGALVPALIGGPLRWLGLVDAVVRPDRSGAFLVRSEIDNLDRRESAAVEEHPPARIVVTDDLTVLVPARTTDVAIHGRMARSGELIEASGEGLRYRLTAAGMQAAFDGGTTGPEFTRFLTERAGKKPPAAVTTAIDRWWSGYGAVRLYDELTLIEFGDDVLLTELMAATSLGASLIHRFSPRLIAIEPARTDELVAELTARGFAPRVIEAG